MSEITKWKQNWLGYFGADSLVDQQVIENGNTDPKSVDVDW